jgi:CheY-like chemotaxis protein
MPKTVLLADDSITIQKVVGISFANEDVKLVSVDNGEAALAKARELRPDLVLADVVMPGLSGYEVCEAMKQDPALRHIPVLLLTGTFEAFDEERARRSGAAGHVAKPFEAQTLVEQVKRLLAAPATRPAAAPPAPPARPAEKAARPAPAPAPRPALAPPAQSNAPRSRPAAAPSAEDSFDFFEEPAGNFSPEPVFEAGGQPGALQFGDSNEAFSFGDDDFGSVEAEAPPAWSAPARRTGRTADATVAILPELDPPRRSGSGRELVFEAEPDESAGDPRGLATLAAELLDEDTGPVASADAFAPDSRVDARFGSTRRELAGHATELFDIEAAEPDRAAPFVDDSDLAGATLLDPGRATGFDVSASDLSEPLVAPPKRALAAPAAGRRAPAPEPRTPRAGSAPATAAAELVRELAPRLREPLHDTLEKIAWESFGSMAEEIVRQAVERMEAVAWEVIPQMAEALIREELSRIKGEGDDPEF